MDKLRFNYRNILHLGHDTLFLRKPGIQVGETVQLILEMKDLACLDNNRAVLLIESIIKDTNGKNIHQSLDTIFLKGLDDAEVQKIKKSSHYNVTNITNYTNLSKRKPILLDADVRYLMIPERFGAQYGKISGDRNPVHTREWLAKLFGYPHAFIQGSATVNFLIKCFVGEQQEQLNQLSIKFCRPIFLNQTIALHFTSSQFELVNQKKELLAFGDRS